MLRLGVIGLAVSGILLMGGLNSESVPQGRAFPSAEAAAEALISAAKADDLNGLMEILGPGADEFVALHPTADNRIRREFAAQAMQKVKLVTVRDRPGEMTLLTGEHEWPLPIPIVAIAGKWY